MCVPIFLIDRHQGHVPHVEYKQPLPISHVDWITLAGPDPNLKFKKKNAKIFFKLPPHLPPASWWPRIVPADPLGPNGRHGPEQIDWIYFYCSLNHYYFFK